MLNLIKLAEESRWQNILIRTPARVLTKQDIFDYYSSDKIRPKLLQQLKNSSAAILQNFTEAISVLKRHESGLPIQIKQDAAEFNDPADYQYWIERRAVEFHPSFGRDTKRLIVDIDPQEKSSLDAGKRATAEVSDALYAHPSVKDIELRYSGGRGFYVLGHLKQPMEINSARELTQHLLQPLLKNSEYSIGLATPNQVRLDLSPMKESGSIRALYSLNKDTGLVSVPVEEEHLLSFDPETDATIEAVVGEKPRKATPFRI